MSLKLFNTISKGKEEFHEINKGQVGMYTCGPTVYDYAHIGNFKAYISADLLKRYLKFEGYKVKHVMNITDVDDKTIKNSRQWKMKLRDYTDKYTNAFFQDLEKLNIDKADFFPRATETIPEMIELIKKLKEKGIAYQGDDKSWYYSVSKFKGYGKLSGIKKDELKAGARVKQDEYEKDTANDFALWKAWSEEDGDVFWETELGKGRPGWHIECSAMSMKYLGKHFDIHTGGVDLVFPHHENEIAQSEGANDSKFVNYWIHNEWLLVDGKKMSKRYGNFFTLRDLLAKGYSARAIRYLLLSSHYKVQFNFTEEGLKSAESTIERMDEFVRNLKSVNNTKNNEKVKEIIEKLKKDFETYMDDDLNIGSALASLFEFMKEINKFMGEDKTGKEDAELVLETMKQIDSVLGVMKFEEEEAPKEILDLVAQREDARKRKDWTEADRLRDLIKEKGYAVDDSKGGARVKKLEAHK
ncbi:cysteine--tRNA ligase [Candidatus Woesearchaeota archaeon]|nr:cysteine--tRNA ligase [Candidatus Woesearchaeota archaeon]